jgi:hypothetical protein
MSFEDTSAYALNSNPSELVSEQEPLRELNEDELALVDGGAGAGTGFRKFAHSDFGKTVIPGVALIGTAVGFFELAHTLKGSNTNS